jgi:NAD(P)-dependent dehydrogenase (short-subunit alcohol dehydrogenase family)
MHDKVVLISGTARGQGRVAALRFAAEGAHVVGGDILEEELRSTQVLMVDRGLDPGRARMLDFTDEEAVAAWIDDAVATHGRIDVVCNNAGGSRFGAIDEQSYADWRHTVTAELDSIFLVTKYAWPHLRENGGAIVNIASTAGMRGSTANPRTALSAAKGGVIAMTQQLAAEGAPHGIRVNSVSPGIVVTEGARETLLHPDHPMFLVAESIPLRRLGAPEDVVNAMLFLASDEAEYITGTNLVVDGGWSAVLPSGLPQLFTS